MRIEHDWTYDAPIGDVFAMVLDTRFQQAKCRHAAALDCSARVTRGEGQDVVRVVRTMSTSDFPAQLRTLVGETLKVEEQQIWPAAADPANRRHATLGVRIVGAPVSLTGGIRMTADGDRTRMQVRGELVARIPLFGSVVERAAAPAVVGAIEIEQTTGAGYLAPS